MKNAFMYLTIIMYVFYPNIHARSVIIPVKPMKNVTNSTSRQSLLSYTPNLPEPFPNPIPLPQPLTLPPISFPIPFTRPPTVTLPFPPTPRRFPFPPTPRILTRPPTRQIPLPPTPRQFPYPIPLPDPLPDPLPVPSVCRCYGCYVNDHCIECLNNEYCDRIGGEFCER